MIAIWHLIGNLLVPHEICLLHTVHLDINFLSLLVALTYPILMLKKVEFYYM